MKRFFLPFLLLWLTVLAIVVVGLSTRSPRSLEEYFLGASYLVFPFMAGLFPIALYGFYQSKMRETYPSITWFTSGRCPVCGEPFSSEKNTANLFQLPNVFKTLLHYEKAHLRIAGIATRARRALVVFVHEIVLGFSTLIAISFFGQTLYVWHNTFLLALAYSVFVFVSVWLAAWAVIAIKLLKRKT